MFETITTRFIGQRSESSNIHRLNFELKVCCLHKKNVFRGNQNSRCVCCQKKLLYFLKSFEKFGSNKD
jgi:hypothetical protein